MRKVKDGDNALGTLLEGKSARLQREQEVVDSPQAPKQKQAKAAFPSPGGAATGTEAKAENDLGLCYRLEDLVFGVGFTMKKVKEPLNYYAILLDNGSVQVEYATLAGKPSGMNKMFFPKEKFESEFTFKDSDQAKEMMGKLKEKCEEASRTPADETDEKPEGSGNANEGLCSKVMDLKVGTGGTSNQTHTEIKFYYAMSEDGQVEVVEATPRGKPWPGMKPRILQKEEFEEQYTIL